MRTDWSRQYPGRLPPTRFPWPVNLLAKLRGTRGIWHDLCGKLHRAVGSDWEVLMKRREFLKSMTALAAGSALPAAPAIWSAAKAQSRQETLLIVSESGPNNIDIHGVGTNVPGYEVSWNCYDRLI